MSYSRGSGSACPGPRGPQAGARGVFARPGLLPRVSHAEPGRQGNDEPDPHTAHRRGLPSLPAAGPGQGRCLGHSDTGTFPFTLHFSQSAPHGRGARRLSWAEAGRASGDGLGCGFTGAELRERGSSWKWQEASLCLSCTRRLLSEDTTAEALGGGSSGRRLAGRAAVGLRFSPAAGAHEEPACVAKGSGDTRWRPA